MQKQRKVESSMLEMLCVVFDDAALKAAVAGRCMY
jgi:hypothetical protein